MVKPSSFSKARILNLDIIAIWAQQFFVMKARPGNCRMCSGTSDLCLLDTSGTAH